MGILVIYLFFLIPDVAIAFFIVSLCLFISERKKNKRAPGSVDIQTLNSRKKMLIISSVIAGIIVAIVIGLIILFSYSISHYM